MGDWNAILYPKIGSDMCESRLIDFMAQHCLVDRFRLDHPGKWMLMWIDISPSVRVRSYLNKVLVTREDTDFFSCPTFHWVAQTNHRLVRIGLRLANWPSLAGYWKFNTSLLVIQNFLDWLEKLIRRTLVGVVTENRSWESLNYRIRDFATKYGRQQKLDRAKKTLDGCFPGWWRAGIP